MPIPKTRSVLSVLPSMAIMCAATAGFTAVSHPRPARSKIVDITYWAGHASGALHAAVVNEVKMFNASHPGIHVTFRDTGATSHGLAAFEAGQAPNVGMLSGYGTPQLIQAGALVNLGPYIHGANGLTSAQIHSRYYPAVWKDMTYPDGVQWLMPLEKKSLLVLYYNENLFRRAGISAPPKTWAQVGADAAKITRLGPGYYGIAWTPALRQFFDLVVSDGGRVFATSHRRTRFALDTPGAEKALGMLRSWVRSRRMIMTTGYQYQLDFGAGKVGMLMDASAGYTYDKGSVGGKFVMGGVPAPQGSASIASQYINGASLAMFNVGTEAQKRASWTFIKWLSSPKVNVYWDEHTNYLPLGPSDYRMMKPHYAAHPAQAASFSNPKFWWYKPHGANYSAAENAVQVILEQGLRGQIGVSAALKKMTNTGTSYLSGKVKG